MIDARCVIAQGHGRSLSDEEGAEIPQAPGQHLGLRDEERRVFGSALLGQIQGSLQARDEDYGSPGLEGLSGHGRGR